VRRLVGKPRAAGAIRTIHGSGRSGVTIGHVERAVHDRGGWPTDAPIDRREHELADWELLIDALVGALIRRGLMNADQLRRGIEDMPPDEYERASYYERWLASIETALTERGVLTPGELDARLAS
jgi:hypothetical protein